MTSVLFRLAAKFRTLSLIFVYRCVTIPEFPQLIFIITTGISALLILLHLINFQEIEYHFFYLLKKIAKQNPWKIAHKLTRSSERQHKKTLRFSRFSRYKRPFIENTVYKLNTCYPSISHFRYRKTIVYGSFVCTTRCVSSTSVNELHEWLVVCGLVNRLTSTRNACASCVTRNSPHFLMGQPQKGYVVISLCFSKWE